MDQLKKRGLLELRGILGNISSRTQADEKEMERQIEVCRLDQQDQEITDLVKKIRDLCASYRKQFEGPYLQIAEEIEKRITE
jgi:hypothetical protein